MINNNLKDISDKDLDSFLRYSSTGDSGVVFFSESFSAIEYDLLAFFQRSTHEVDSLVVVGKENTFNEDFINICCILPYVSFIYQNANPDQILKYFNFKVFYKYKNQTIPNSFQESVDLLENCETREY